MLLQRCRAQAPPAVRLCARRGARHAAAPTPRRAPSRAAAGVAIAATLDAAAATAGASDGRLRMTAEVADTLVTAVVIGSPSLWEGGVVPPPEASTDADADSVGPWVALWAKLLTREDAWPAGMFDTLQRCGPARCLAARQPACAPFCFKILQRDGCPAFLRRVSPP
jgi:hypothetical protein